MHESFEKSESNAFNENLQGLQISLSLSLSLSLSDLRASFQKQRITYHNAVSLWKGISPSHEKRGKHHL